MNIDDRDTAPAAPVQTTLAAIFFSMELSRSSWLITSLSAGGGEKISKRAIPAGDVAGLMAVLGHIKEKARLRTGENYPFVSIQEAGLDGFWIRRMLEQEGVDSHVVDPASVTTSRRRRRAKTDKLDGETLLRTLLAYKRGRPADMRDGAPAKPGRRGSPPQLSRAARADRRGEHRRASDGYCSLSSSPNSTGGHNRPRITSAFMSFQIQAGRIVR